MIIDMDMKLTNEIDFETVIMTDDGNFLLTAFIGGSGTFTGSSGIIFTANTNIVRIIRFVMALRAPLTSGVSQFISSFAD